MENQNRTVRRRSFSPPSLSYWFIVLALLSLLISRKIAALTLFGSVASRDLSTAASILHPLIAVFAIIAGIIITIFYNEFNSRRIRLLLSASILLMLAILMPLESQLVTLFVPSSLIIGGLAHIFYSYVIEGTVDFFVLTVPFFLLSAAVFRKRLIAISAAAFVLGIIYTLMDFIIIYEETVNRLPNLYNFNTYFVSGYAMYSHIAFILAVLSTILYIMIYVIGIFDRNQIKS